MNTHGLHQDVGRIALASHSTLNTDNRHLQVCAFTSNRTDHVGVTTIERLDQCHLYPNLEVPGLTCPGRESNPGPPRGKRSLLKSPSRQLVNSYSEHLHMNRGQSQQLLAWLGLPQVYSRPPRVSQALLYFQTRHMDHSKYA